ncbi:ABC transporter ATP-binding protein [Ihubacter sp. rT4E-8]|uniref:ABC transporter ATP-binding protein n=1 Tax=unclassified Ihubacter TaxID=2633299 RepID=UPI001379FB46
MIEIKNVTKKYSGQKALNDISLAIPQGQIIGLFGENGAGKTTLMKCILGFLRYQGNITLDSAPITHQNISRISFATGEHSFFSALTPQQHQEFYQMQFPGFRNKRYHGLMEFFQLPEKKALKNFSVGQQNQFEVILALSQGADYILMDEPFSGNDVFNREDFYKVLLGILEPEETILLSTHLLEEVEKFIDRAILIHRGTLAADTSMDKLDETGKTLLQFVKETYRYKQDRVSRALSAMTEERE